MARYEIDGERSTVTVLRRPVLGPPDLPPASIDGRVEIDGERVTGTVAVTLAGRTVDVDVAESRPDVTTGPDGELVLHGGTRRPVGAFGLAGPSMLNPTIELRWRLTLVES